MTKLGAVRGTGESDGRDYAVRAVDRVCSILDLLQRMVDGVSLADVAVATDLPKSSAFRYLRTLEAHCYVERNLDSGLYTLGLGFVGMQSRQLEILRQRTRPVLERLRDQLQETINLGVLDGDVTIYVDIVESKRAVRLAARRGDREPIHCTGLGKAIASRLDERRVRAILAEVGMEARTPKTITSVEVYLAELGKARRTGYALDNGEAEIDGRCVAVPILGTPLPAALSLSAPASRLPLQDVERVAEVLKDAVKTLAAGLDGQDAGPT